MACSGCEARREAIRQAYETLKTAGRNSVAGGLAWLSLNSTYGKFGSPVDEPKGNDAGRRLVKFGPKRRK